MSVVNVLVIDGFNLIRRIYEAGKTDRTSADAHVSGDGNNNENNNENEKENLERTVSSTASSIKRALEYHKPSHACCVLDSHDKTWRHLLYFPYKADRKKTPSVLLDNLGAFEQACDQLGVRSLKLESYEADDVIATMACGIASGHGNAVILSTDKSYLQLLGDHISVYDHFKNCAISPEDVVEKYGVRVDQLTDYWALAGDRSNNIKGVEGVGEKTAQKLLTEFDTLDAILRSDSNEKSVGRIKRDRDVALRCQVLVKLKLDVEMGINLKDLRLTKDV